MLIFKNSAFQGLVLSLFYSAICIQFVQRRPNVFAVGPTLYKCYVSCLLGSRTCVTSFYRSDKCVSMNLTQLHLLFFINSSNFQALEVVDLGSHAQLEVVIDDFN